MVTFSEPSPRGERAPALLDGVSRATEAGLTYLDRQQLSTGHFRLWKDSDPALTRVPEQHDTIFGTACISYCLLHVRSEKGRRILSRAVDALALQVSERGPARYFTDWNSTPLPGTAVPMRTTIMPDADDTSCTAFVLRECGRPACAPDVLRGNRSPEGLFYTWFMEEPPDVDETFPFVYMAPLRNDVCAGVNANVLLYLGEDEWTRPACQYWRDLALSSGLEGHGVWWPDDSLWYLFSRAYAHGVPTLATLGPVAADRLLARRQSNGSFGGVLATAMAVCTLLNFGLVTPELGAAAQFLVDHQASDGSWAREAFYQADQSLRTIELRLAGVRRQIAPPASGSDEDRCYFGSEEVTTALCLEALARYHARSNG